MSTARHPLSRFALAAVTALTVSAGCGDEAQNLDDGDLSCGAGTHVDGAHCAPDLACGAGTRAVDGQCTPDGSLICVQGTRYEAATATCVVDPAACADGSVLVAGHCVARESTAYVDAEEAAEPNQGNGRVAGTIALPAVGSPGFVVHGCLASVPGQPAGGDNDEWSFDVDRPTLLRVTDDGVGGLVGGFIVFSRIQSLNADGWWRGGVNMTGDTARRQIFLPSAGKYVISFGDSREILDGSAAGGPGACYFGTIEQLAIPAPQPLPATDVTGTLASDELRFYGFTPASDELIHAVIDMPQHTAVGALVLVDGDRVRLATEDEELRNGPPAGLFASDLAAGKAAMLVLDPILSYGLAPAPFTLSTRRIERRALTAASFQVAPTAAALPGPTGDLSRATLRSFDVGADEMVRLELTSERPVNSLILAADGTVAAFGSARDVASLVGGGPHDASLDQWMRLAPGRYYLAVTSPFDDAAIAVTARLTRAPIVALTLDGAPAPLKPAGGFAWYRVASEATWLSVAIRPATFAADSEVTIYDGEGLGAFDPQVAITWQQFGGGELPAAVGVDSGSYLVRIHNPAAATGADIVVGHREYEDLGELALGSFGLGGDLASASDVRRYLLRGESAAAIRFAVVPDPALDVDLTSAANRGHADAHGPGGRETVAVLWPRPAVGVEVRGRRAGHFALLVSMVDPAAEGVPALCEAGCLGIGAVAGCNDAAAGACAFACQTEALSSSAGCEDETRAYYQCLLPQPYTCSHANGIDQPVHAADACQVERDRMRACTGA